MAGSQARPRRWPEEGPPLFSGAFRERLRNSWVEMRENPARSALQALGVILGVASVLGGFHL